MMPAPILCSPLRRLLIISPVLFVTFVCAPTSAAACENNPPTAESVSFPLSAERILFLGDSITHAGGYIAEIETQLRLQGLSRMPKLINAGLPSETCSGLSEPDHPFPRPDVHERLDRALAKVQPDVVVACYGMNDGIYYPFSKARFDAYRNGLRRLIEKVHAADAKLVLLTPPPFDPTPLQGTDQLRPGSAASFAWFAIYEGYDREVIRRYAKHVMSLADQVEMVIDTHTPISDFLAERRRKDPHFHIADDGVHIDETGHQVMAQAVLTAWGVASWEAASDELKSLVKQKQKLLHDAWLTDIGHQRPNTKVGQPLPEARQAAAKLEQQIAPWIEKLRRPAATRRSSTGGVIHRLHFPASLRGGELKLYVDFYLWVPDNVRQLRGIIVHQHGCGPGASIGGQTAADDLHWQALARRHHCALLGSSYEPQRGVNCRLWCDARQGSADRFLQALEELAAASGYAELNDVPWCLWGHSGGGFWASLMQTRFPDRIVAIWLQSGTAFSYWTEGEIDAPEIAAAAYGVPVMGCPGAKEKGHERFHRAWDGIVAMRNAYRERGAAFFEFAPDPQTGHECGDSRYLSIPFFDFWLTQRLPRHKDNLQPVDAAMLAAWDDTMADRLRQFAETGAVEDDTPPPRPQSVTRSRNADGHITVSWTATADLESGIQAFIIERNGKPIASIPDNPASRFGRPLFQGLSYHDTPVAFWPPMQWTDTDSPGDQVPEYSVRTVNSVGLKSSPVTAKRRGDH